MDELRLALRRLTKRPAATLVSVATLAVAIGAAAATWSLLSAVLLHPLPVRQPDRVFVAGQMTTMGSRAGLVYDGFVYPYLPALRASAAFERVAAEWGAPLQLLVKTPDGSVPLPKTLGFATWDLFDLLGIRVSLGRGFTTTDDRRGAPLVAILTDEYWRRTFDGQRDVVGRTLTIAGKAVTIVGILQPGVHGLDLSQPVDAYLPFHTIGDVGSPLINYFGDPSHANSPTWGTKLVVRLRDGDTAEQAASRAEAVNVPLPGARPAILLTPINADAIPATARAGMRQFTRLLGMTVGLLLIIGCGTVGMLLLIRTEARRDELAMCVALGASRRRLASGIVLEGAALSCGGASAAVPVAWWLYRGSTTFQLPGGIDIGHLDLGIDLRTVAACGAAAIFASLLMSLIAAAFGVSASVADALRSRSGATPRLTRRRTRAALVIGQVAVAVVLVSGAGLFARSLAAALGLNTSLDMSRLVTTYVNLSPYGYNLPRATEFFDDLRTRLTANPGITSVAYTFSQGGMLGKLVVNGTPRQFPTQVRFSAVDRNYFQTTGLRLTSGRDFTQSDGPGAPLVAIISTSFARELAGAGGESLGTHVRLPFSKAGKSPEVEVVGIVDDVVTRISELRPLDVYFPTPQRDPTLTRTVMVRTAAGASAAEREIMGAVKAIDPSVSPSEPRTLADDIGRQMSAQRFGALVLGALGSISLLLAILGTYVLSESMASMRMREMGIRAALGATRRQLGAIVVGETARLVGAGLLAGFGLASLGASTIRALLFQITPFDRTTLVSVAVLIFVLALAVSVRPALRAARVDLSGVLKEM
jgi:putative ABC transport system permease protein